jgi:hypothetical protein
VIDTRRLRSSRRLQVSVSLPQTLAALLPVVNRACTLAEYQSGRCRKAEAGSAIARTPLLKDPLTGGAFFVRHPGRPLPDLMVALRGDIDIDLVGRVTIPGGTRLATNFDTIPDAPVSKFTLNSAASPAAPARYFGVGNCARIIASHMRSGISRRDGIDSFAEGVIVTRVGARRLVIDFSITFATRSGPAPSRRSGPS